VPLPIPLLSIFGSIPVLQKALAGPCLAVMGSVVSILGSKCTEIEQARFNCGMAFPWAQIAEAIIEAVHHVQGRQERKQMTTLLWKVVFVWKVLEAWDALEPGLLGANQ
jgi:hypothetical protein